MTTVIGFDGKDGEREMELLRLWVKWDRVGDDLNTQDEMQRDFMRASYPERAR